MFICRNLNSTCSHNRLTNIFVRQHVALNILSYNRRTKLWQKSGVCTCFKRCRGILPMVVCIWCRPQGFGSGKGATGVAPVRRDMGLPHAGHSSFQLGLQQTYQRTQLRPLAELVVPLGKHI